MFFFLFKAVTEEYLEVSKEIDKANDIVIIGGGAIFQKTAFSKKSP